MDIPYGTFDRKGAINLKEIEMSYMGYVIFGLVAMVVIDAILLATSYNYLNKH